jgi:hypothetical protein
MMKAVPPGIRSLLLESGYRVLTRTNGWADCLIQRDAERWEGRGRTEDEALADAIARMLPSHLAAVLVDRWLASAAQPAASSPSTAVASADAAASKPSLPADPAPAVAAPPVAPAPEAPLPAVVALPAAAVSPAPKEATATPIAAIAASTEPIVVADAASSVAEPPSVAAPSSRIVEPKPRPRVGEVLGSVERLVVEIEDRLPRLARMSADLERLQMMVWICRARALEEAVPGARDLEQAVARVARRLTEIGKMLWPGSVRALQLSARPADVRRELHASWASEPANWREATALAERLLQEQITKVSDSGLDADGWADSAARSPRPTEPDALLETVDAEIQAILAAVGEPQGGRTPEVSGSDIDKLVTLARKLRWLRGGVKDDVAWGSSVGRLRRAVPSLGDRGSRVREALDHRTKPSVPWAKLLGDRVEEPAAPPGENPEALRAELATAKQSTEGLVAWLIRALDVLNTPDLVALMVPLRAELDAFGEDTLNHPDRRVRRRIRELVKRVASAADAQPEAPPPASEPAAPEDDAADDNLANRALDELASRVRQQTEGRRVLFVSNREDPDLGSRLTDLLGVEITWCDGSLRRVQAQCERIKGGAYDLILSATGFQVHGVDSAVSRAAGAASVPYVRVNRGRPVACVQAIAREFGLHSGVYRLETPARAASDD